MQQETANRAEEMKIQEFKLYTNFNVKPYKLSHGSLKWELTALTVSFPDNQKSIPRKIIQRFLLTACPSCLLVLNTAFG